MPLGPGKYDELCTQARVKAKADGAVVIIINGERGSGFSVQGDLMLQASLPDVLENVAAQIRHAFESTARN